MRSIDGACCSDPPVEASLAAGLVGQGIEDAGGGPSLGRHAYFFSIHDFRMLGDGCAVAKIDQYFSPAPSVGQTVRRTEQVSRTSSMASNWSVSFDVHHYVAHCSTFMHLP